MALARRPPSFAFFSVVIASRRRSVQQRDLLGGARPRWRRRRRGDAGSTSALSRLRLARIARAGSTTSHSTSKRADDDDPRDLALERMRLADADQRRRRTRSAPHSSRDAEEACANQRLRGTIQGRRRRYLMSGGVMAFDASAPARSRCAGSAGGRPAWCWARSGRRRLALRRCTAARVGQLAPRAWPRPRRRAPATARSWTGSARCGSAGCRCSR